MIKVKIIGLALCVVSGAFAYTIGMVIGGFDPLSWPPEWLAMLTFVWAYCCGRWHQQAKDFSDKN
jgi:hypothetical protein